jgi:hypothetical protein
MVSWWWLKEKAVCILGLEIVNIATHLFNPTLGFLIIKRLQQPGHACGGRLEAFVKHPYKPGCNAIANLNTRLTLILGSAL